MHSLAKFIYFDLLGWNLVGTFPKIDKCVVVVAPHTSNMDFFLGILIRRVMNEEFNFIAKKSLFQWPWGWYFRWMGGMPIDRSRSANMVEASIMLLNRSKKIHLTLAPEGTRKKVTEWKTGFYYIAKGAHVPIVLVAFDYGKKEVKISEPLFPTDSFEIDLKTYKSFYQGVEGKVRDNSA